jgi:hypothetical protein
MRAGLIPLVLSLFIAIPAAASAETVFTYTPDGGSAITFSPDQATVLAAVAGVGIVYGLTPSGDQASLFNPAATTAANDGPAVFEFIDHVNGTDTVYEGLQLYSGPESSPIFTPGTYQLTADSKFPNNTGTGTFTIANIAATPEPSSFLLLGTAAAGAIQVARRRRKDAIRYPWRASN